MADTEARTRETPPAVEAGSIREALVVVVAGWGHMYGPDPTKWPDFAMANVNAYVARLAAPLGDRTPPAVEAGSISERECRRLVEDAFFGGYNFGWAENDGREEPPEEYMETAWRNSHARQLLDRLAALRAGVPAPPTAPGLEETLLRILKYSGRGPHVEGEHHRLGVIDVIASDALRKSRESQP